MRSTRTVGQAPLGSGTHWQWRDRLPEKPRGPGRVMRNLSGEQAEGSFQQGVAEVGEP